jgi:hypothetical protein
MLVTKLEDACRKNKKPPLKQRRLYDNLEEGISMTFFTPLQTWQRPTLPRLETKYHRRWGVSRPSSEWDRVQPPRHNHQVGERVKKDDFWSGHADLHDLGM